MEELRAWIKELGFPAAVAAFLLYFTNTTVTSLLTAVQTQVAATQALAKEVHDLRESLDYHGSWQPPSSPHASPPASLDAEPPPSQRPVSSLALSATTTASATSDSPTRYRPPAVSFPYPLQLQPPPLHRHPLQRRQPFLMIRRHPVDAHHEKCQIPTPALQLC